MMAQPPQASSPVQPHWTPALPAVGCGMSPLADRSLPLVARIVFAVLFVAMVGALGGALALLARNTEHPMRVFIIAGIVWCLTRARAIWEKRRHLSK